MPYLIFTKLIINHFFSQHKSLAKLKHSDINTIKDDGVLNRLKFIRTNEDYQEYGLSITNKMLTDKIKQSKAYQTVLALSTGLIPPKKTRGKGSKRKKQTVTPKKKSSIFLEDNIILEPDVALELGKSISKTEAEIAEEERRLHETHERLVTAKLIGVNEYDESNSEPANRPTRRKIPSVMTDEEQLAADMKKAIKASKEALGLQQQTIDSSEGAGITPEAPDELTGKFTTSKEGAGIILEVPDGGKDEITWLSTDEEEKGTEDDDEVDDDRSIGIAKTNDERTYAKNGDQAMTDAENIVAKKLKEEKGDEEEEQADDDQAEDDNVGILVTMSQKEKL
nr:hypothetical protein [Tanacetum cinerariifolium]